MTLCIALCDDDKIALNNELRLIKDVLNEKKIKHSIDIFSSPQKLLQSDTVYDIIECLDQHGNDHGKRHGDD